MESFVKSLFSLCVHAVALITQLPQESHMQHDTYVALSFILGNYITVQWLGQDWYRVIGSTFILFFAFGSIGQ